MTAIYPDHNATTPIDPQAADPAAQAVRMMRGGTVC